MPPSSWLHAGSLRRVLDHEVRPCRSGGCPSPYVQSMPGMMGKGITSERNQHWGLQYLEKTRRFLWGEMI